MAAFSDTSPEEAPRPEKQREQKRFAVMRWKLLLVASLLAAVAGVAAPLGLGYLLGRDPSGSFPASPDLLVAGLLLLPLAATLYASIFVYRHTARRRSLQAMATALFSMTLTLALLYATMLLLSRRRPLEQPMPPQTLDSAG
ncbi:MAG TPA: hypothetical protein VEQ42_05890 [Pyrinomonadaceae bacterium]|nr:hypothetical protein [Pyrinomonadaceae bacterium]